MPDPDQNRRTEYRYNADGPLVELTGINGSTGDQVTRWEYGATLSESGVASKDLVRAKVYPDDVSGSDRVEYQYNCRCQRSAIWPPALGGWSAPPPIPPMIPTGY